MACFTGPISDKKFFDEVFVPFINQNVIVAMYRYFSPHISKTEHLVKEIWRASVFERKELTLDIIGSKLEKLKQFIIDKIDDTYTHRIRHETTKGKLFLQKNVPFYPDICIFLKFNNDRGLKSNNRILHEIGQHCDLYIYVSENNILYVMGPDKMMECKEQSQFNENVLNLKQSTYPSSSRQ